MPIFTLAGIGLSIKNAYGWLVAHPRVVAYVVGGIIILTILFYAYKGCTSPPVEEKRTEVQEKLTKSIEATKKADVLESSVNADKEEVTKAKAEADKAQKDFLEEVNRSASEHSNDYEKARAKYCASHPEDCK